MQLAFDVKLEILGGAIRKQLGASKPDLSDCIQYAKIGMSSPIDSTKLVAKEILDILENKL